MNALILLTDLVLPLLTSVADQVPDDEDVKAGWVAFGVFIALAIAVALLGFSLTAPPAHGPRQRRARGLRPAGDPPGERHGRARRPALAAHPLTHGHRPMTTERATGTLVWVRAFVLAAVALATGAVAHVQADGLLPGTDVLLVVTALGALACAPLLTREVSTPAPWSLLLVAGQSVVHLVLAATAGHRGTRSASAPTTDRHAGHADAHRPARAPTSTSPTRPPPASTTPG